MVATTFSVNGIEIVIRDGTETLETRSCRTMLLPDGRSGAVWRGLVYPVQEATQIDIAGEAFPPQPHALVDLHPSQMPPNSHRSQVLTKSTCSFRVQLRHGRRLPPAYERPEFLSFVPVAIWVTSLMASPATGSSGSKNPQPG